MRRLLRRFAAVGVVVTLVDVVVLLIADALGQPLVVADLTALSTAAILSHNLHTRITFSDDPHARLIREPGPFMRIALLGALIDIAVLVAFSQILSLLPSKLIALSMAAAVRVVLYRRQLLKRVRVDQARRGDRAEAPGDVRFSVVIPAFREEERIGGTVSALRGALGGVETEIVVVDDGSDDGTAAAARAAGADQVVVLEENAGKGAAVRAGVLAARGRTIAFTDADLAYPPSQLLKLLRAVESGWDMVVGSRRHVDTTTLVRARRVRELSGRLFNLFTLLVLLGQYRDTQCGLKAFRSDAAKRVFRAAKVDGFAFDVELFHLAERYRLSLHEVPVELANTETSTVRLGRDALRMVRDLLRIRTLASTGSYEEAPH